VSGECFGVFVTTRARARGQARPGALRGRPVHRPDLAVRESPQWSDGISSTPTATRSATAAPLPPRRPDLGRQPARVRRHPGPRGVPLLQARAARPAPRDPRVRVGPVELARAPPLLRRRDRRGRDRGRPRDDDPEHGAPEVTRTTTTAPRGDGHVELKKRMATVLPKGYTLARRRPSSRRRRTRLRRQEGRRGRPLPEHAVHDRRARQFQGDDVGPVRRRPDLRQGDQDLAQEAQAPAQPPARRLADRGDPDPGFLPADPDRFPHQWYWPSIGEHADPDKVASAQGQRLRTAPRASRTSAPRRERLGGRAGEDRRVARPHVDSTASGSSSRTC
jgi:hypothetical protein